MSQAERDPSVLVSATIRHNRKIVALPSNDARWAWVVCLGAAKLRRPPGLFESRPVLDAILGDLAGHVDSFVSARLLHVSPLRCRDCRESWPRVNGGVLVVHDFAKHQRTSTPRVQKHRGKGVSGNAPETGVERSVKRDETFPTGALSHSPSQVAINGSPEGGPGETDPLDEAIAWLASRRAWVSPGSKVHTELARMVDRKGLAAVIAAMGAVPDAEDGAQFVYGARNALYPLPGSQTVTKEATEAQARARRRAELGLEALS